MRIHSAALAALTVLSVANPVSAQVRNQSRRDLRAPDVSVWIDRFTYRPGQRIRTFFQSDEGAFVTVVRVSTSGDVSVLYPRRPSLQQAYRIDALADDEVPYASDLPFFVNEPEGVGFVFAIASNYPFDYRSISNRDRWNTWQFSSSAYSGRYGMRSYPDPYETIGRFIDQTLPQQADYSTDYIQYQVISDVYRPRRLANYDDVYQRCLSAYIGRADYYCLQYAGYGYPFYGQRFIARNPATPATPPTTPGKNLPRLPGRIHPEPPSGGDGIEKSTKPLPSPANSEVERANAQRAWWNAQKRDGDRGNPSVRDRALRTDPQTPLPEVYRSLPSAPRVETRPPQNSERGSQPQYEQPLERRAAPREMPVPQQMRPEPMSGGKYETPRPPQPEVFRSEPMHVAPSPPPAPAPQQHSAPVAAPPSAPSSPPSAPSAPISRPAEKTAKDQ
ncbi:MAG TPA: DUF4384 domain-containing protein [Gemmatimonadaceae bacterium]|nr:DUF4384 domain-containing protein [Gemmatimonadaceae bacterium]